MSAFMFLKKDSVIFFPSQDATCAISFLPRGLKSQQCPLPSRSWRSSAAKHLNKHLKLSLCIVLLKEVKKYECTLKCTEISYKLSEDLHSKGNWWHFYTESSYSLVMAFQLIAKFHTFNIPQDEKKINSSKPSFQLGGFFFHSHKTWKIKQNITELTQGKKRSFTQV